MTVFVAASRSVARMWPDEIALCRVAPVKLGAMQNVEIPAEIEMVDDVAGIGFQLGSGDRQEIALVDERGQRLGNARDELVLELADVA